jgi:hypothetical protein
MRNIYNYPTIGAAIRMSIRGVRKTGRTGMEGTPEAVGMRKV